MNQPWIKRWVGEPLRLGPYLAPLNDLLSEKRLPSCSFSFPKSAVKGILDVAKILLLSVMYFVYFLGVFQW